MPINGKSPTAAQKDFHNNLRSLYPGFVIHHPVGTTGKHNKVLIGHWWVIALTVGEHHNIHKSSDRKAEEKSIYESQMRMYFSRYFEMPVPGDVLKAIMSWRM